MLKLVPTQNQQKSGAFPSSLSQSDSFYFSASQTRLFTESASKLATELCLTSLLTNHYNIRRSLCDFNYNDPTDEQQLGIFNELLPSKG